MKYQPFNFRNKRMASRLETWRIVNFLVPLRQASLPEPASSDLGSLGKQLSFSLELLRNLRLDEGRAFHVACKLELRMARGTVYRGKIKNHRQGMSRHWCDDSVVSAGVPCLCGCVIGADVIACHDSLWLVPVEGGVGSTCDSHFHYFANRWLGMCMYMLMYRGGLYM